MDPSISNTIQTIDQVLRDVYSSGVTATDDGEKEIHPTGMRAEQGLNIARIMNACGAQRTIETGFAFGLSGLFMVRSALFNGLASDTQSPSHFAFDPYQSANWGNAGRRLFARAGVSHLLSVGERRSEHSLPELADAGEQFDLGLVDGDHKFDAAFVDVFYMTRIVRPGGVILVDDT